MNDVQPDEVVYTDYKDEARKMKTNIKFKTTAKKYPLLDGGSRRNIQ